MTTSNAAAALSGTPAAPAPASVTPPAGGAPATPPAGGAPAPAPAPGGDAWFSGIQNQDVRTWAEAKGFKDPLAVVESAYNLEKVMGFDRAGRTVVMPGENATPEEVKAFHAKIGVPETADGYNLPVGEGGDGAFAKQAAQWMHEAGVPAGAAEKLAGKWNEFLAAQGQQSEQQFATMATQEMQSWQAEQGAALQQNMELARRATAQFLPEKLTVGAEQIDRGEALNRIERAIGTANMMKLFSTIGQGLSEHKVLQGGGSGVMTPAQAAQRMTELKSNKEWTSAYLNGDKAKAQEMQQLIALAFPAQG